jgi:hypothetical protein
MTQNGKSQKTNPFVDVVKTPTKQVSMWAPARTMATDTANSFQMSMARSKIL